MSIIKFGQQFAARLATKNRRQIVAVRGAGHWNRDYLPGPYPETEEERKKAAEKYGMHPNEYEPYPDDGWGKGDYPKLPDVGAALKDPYYPYDNPVWRRNFGEPIHANFELHTEDKLDIGQRMRFSQFQIYFYTFLFYGTFYAIFYFSREIYFVLPAAEKQYPDSGVTHYTFEPAEK